MMTVLFIYHCFYFLQLVAVFKTLQLHPPAVDFYISIFVTINLLFQKIFTPPPLQEGFFFCLNPPQNLPSPSSSFSSDVPLKNFPVLIFWKPTILFALLPEIGGGKIIFKCYKSCKTFQLLNIKKITNLPLSRCHYFFSFYLTKYTCYSVLLISNGGSETMIPFLHSLWL